jgi:aryl-alcohol dehydrogenase-like predicted oxidoreductase
MAGHVELGCGLIAIGRPWGTTPEVPSKTDALLFLDEAFDAGVRYFDTAPSYGLSEERLGEFLSSISDKDREEIFVSTKCGESWDSVTGAGLVDHSKEALITSIERSLGLLGNIALLQIHKANLDVLRDEAVNDAIEFARRQGIAHIGASASDVETADAIITDPRFDYLQVPYNAASPQFQEPIERSRANGMRVLTNRPFQMGALSAEQTGDRRQAAVDAFKYILEADFDGVILTGTSNPEHLAQNLAAFREAQAV